jgi:hypothetical protein
MRPTPESAERHEAEGRHERRTLDELAAFAAWLEPVRPSAYIRHIRNDPAEGGRDAHPARNTVRLGDFDPGAASPSSRTVAAGVRRGRCGRCGGVPVRACGGAGQAAHRQFAQSDDKKVDLNGLTFSLTSFGPGMDPSSITDFNGFVGVADVQGTGTAHNADGSTETLLYDTDMRFMTGTYVGKDGQNYKGTFGFV